VDGSECLRPSTKRFRDGKQLSASYDAWEPALQSATWLGAGLRENSNIRPHVAEAGAFLPEEENAFQSGGRKCGAPDGVHSRRAEPLIALAD